MTRGVATKLGIDYAACRAITPDVVYCNTYAYGLADPLGKFGGLDPLYQAAPASSTRPAAIARGQRAALLPLRHVRRVERAALDRRRAAWRSSTARRTGEGQELWTSLLDGGVIFSSDVVPRDGKPWDRPRLDRDLTGLSALYRLYRTQDDDWIMVAAVKDSEWEALCGVLARRAPRSTTRGSRPAASATSTGASSRACSSRCSARRPRATGRGMLDDADVPNEVPIDTLDGEQVLYDADNERLGLVTEYVHPLVGRDAPVRRPHPVLGDAGAHPRSRPARRPGHTRDPARARLPRRRRSTRSIAQQRRLRGRRRLPTRFAN